METYNKIYGKNKNAFGIKPAPILETALESVENIGMALDIGAGQGRNSLYLANSGFTVDSIETSGVAIEHLKSLDNSEINPILVSIEDFKIKMNKYDLISAINVLQFVEEDNIAKVIKKIQEGLKSGGVVAITSFTEDDPTFSDYTKPRFNKYFSKGELKRYFSDFDIIYYCEELVEDKGHGGMPYPHQHGIVEIVARKG